jgi:hypothetical protein
MTLYPIERRSEVEASDESLLAPTPSPDLREEAGDAAEWQAALTDLLARGPHLKD